MARWARIRPVEDGFLEELLTHKGQLKIAFLAVEELDWKGVLPLRMIDLAIEYGCSVVPAKAGTQRRLDDSRWIPAFAGMTRECI
jgi:hypothetical protein